MNVLVVNAGSSSLKYQLMNSDTNEVYAKGNCERIGMERGIFGHEVNGAEKVKDSIDFPDHKAAIKVVLDHLAGVGVEIQGIGHRLVQGGSYFTDSALVDDEVMVKLNEAAPLAPLHNYGEIAIIEYCREQYPSLPNVAVFDTSFHTTMPEAASRYPLPTEVCEKLHIRKYGAHGTSHRYEWMKAHELLGEKVHKLLSCHLGNGSSLAAIVDGQCQDTTMGLTPLDGLMMGTRTGSIDPATACYLQREGGYSFEEVDSMMNKQSGLLAVSERSSDMRDILEAAEAGDEKCQLALDMFYYKATQQAAMMIAAMGGVDTISFTAGIGENDPLARQKVIEGLSFIGAEIDDKLNHSSERGPRTISSAASKVHIMVIPTDEEYMIAKDVERLAS